MCSWTTTAIEKFDAGEKPLPGIRVSNGREIATTDDEGKLRAAGGRRRHRVCHQAARLSHAAVGGQAAAVLLHPQAARARPSRSFAGVEPTGPLPASIDFPLYRAAGARAVSGRSCSAIRSRAINRKSSSSAHDVVEELIGTDASFGVTLGDIAFNDLDTFETLNKHDRADRHSLVQRDRQPRHQLRSQARPAQRRDVRARVRPGLLLVRLRPGALHRAGRHRVVHSRRKAARANIAAGWATSRSQFIRNDLAMIPADQMVVLMMHIPIVGVHDREELYRLIEKRPFCISISGHTHHHEHRYIKKEDGWLGPEPHHHIINVTVCGSWWSGAPDERGIPHATMADGAPNGYSIISFDGTKYRARLQSRRPTRPTIRCKFTRPKPCCRRQTRRDDRLCQRVQRLGTIESGNVAGRRRLDRRCSTPRNRPRLCQMTYRPKKPRCWPRRPTFRQHAQAQGIDAPLERPSCRAADGRGNAAADDSRHRRQRQAAHGPARDSASSLRSSAAAAD